MNDQLMLARFWGKTPATGESAERFHPAIHHMIDVGCVAEALLRDGPPRLRAALKHSWDGCNPELLMAWLPLLIATHDLGKISAAFQGQAKQESARIQRERLIALGVDFPATTIKDLYHAEISAVWIDRRLDVYEPNTSAYIKWALRDAMGGHHGHFADRGTNEIRKAIEASEGRGAKGQVWADWRDKTYQLLHALFNPPGALSAVGEPRRLRAASVILTGFIVWSDWMGSHSEDFKACPELAPDDYIAESRRRAAHALAKNDLDSRRTTTTAAAYTDLFPQQGKPRPLQQVIEALPTMQLKGPLMAVIEAPTGEGKTEAALMLARRIAAENDSDVGGTDEIFFALPTMASGNQMFKRLEDFYTSLYGEAGAVHLTHSQAPSVEEELRRSVMSPDSDGSNSESLSAPAALQWYAGPKKAILAPFGVGTVDQVELAGLNVRHYMLRLLGFANKVVVIDEVHAYDAYMNTILDHTLEWLAALGCSVILLSATLPSDRHRTLAASYFKGLEIDTEPNFDQPLPYPSVSLYGRFGQQRHSCDVFRAAQQFTMQLTIQMDAASEAARLIELVQDGGAVARLCNRVDDAQAIYAELDKRLANTTTAILLHARFPLDKRQKYEGQINSVVGKDSKRTIRDRIIIVGTQVLEQSLDFDVDIMITDFAPVDLLLQRAGRLHRHQRDRPARHQRANLEVVVPAHADSEAPAFPRWERIYSPYILENTWNVLFGIGLSEREVVLPRDYRPLIESVYGAAETTATSDKKRKEYDVALAKMTRQARQFLTPEVNSPDAITDSYEGEFVEEDSAKAQGQMAKTRLGDRVTLIPIYGDHDKQALDLTMTMPLPAAPPRLIDHYGLTQKAILARGIPVSDPKIVAAFRDENRLSTMKWSWNEVPTLLASTYPLLLNNQHHAVIDGRKLTLDQNLGLIIEKEET